MRIIVNAKPVEVPSAITLDRWLEGSEFAERRCAVAVNEDFVPQSARPRVLLREGDRVDVVEAIQGG